MSEKTFKTIEDVEQLILWMQSPPDHKPVIAFDAAPYLERLQRADNWLRTHMSTRKVWPMMLAHYQSKGDGYSERTARRDVEDAQKLFASLESHQALYWTFRYIDLLSEKAVGAASAGKLTEFARLSKEVREWFRYAEEIGVKDISKLFDEVPRLLMFAPEETGVEPNPNALEEAQLWLEQRKQRDKAKHLRPVTDATFTEDQPPTDEPG